MEKLVLKNKDSNLLKVNFKKSLDNPDFNELVNTIELPNEVLMKYTSKLMDASLEYANCKKCKSFLTCKNKIKGYCFKPIVLNESLTFSYTECDKKHEIDEKNKYLNNVYYFEIPVNLKNASLKNIYKDDSNRLEVIKKVKVFYDNYKKGIYSKGIYLSGSFGSGKSYIIAALFNELAKLGIESAIIYFPEFLRKLKANLGRESYDEIFEVIKKVPVLSIDDIGAENITEWVRDEILGTILQYRMDNKLATFFTSNLNLKELENHLQITNSSSGKVKARRIMERINYLCDETTLIGINRRSE